MKNSNSSEINVPYKLIKTSHFIMSWVIIVFLAGGTWAWSQYRMEKNEERDELMDKRISTVETWINTHTSQEITYSLQRTRQWYEIQRNLYNICKKLGISYEVVPEDDVSKDFNFNNKIKAK